MFQLWVRSLSLSRLVIFNQQTFHVRYHLLRLSAIYSVWINIRTVCNIQWLQSKHKTEEQQRKLYIFEIIHFSMHIYEHISHIFDELSGCHCALLSTYVRAAAACSHSFIRSCICWWCFFLPCSYTHIRCFVFVVLVFIFITILWCIIMVYRVHSRMVWAEQECLYMWYLMCTWYTASIHWWYTSIAERTVCVCLCASVWRFVCFFVEKSVFLFGFSIIF